MTPRVSVVMPAYNAALYVNEAIDSILAQTFGNFELIIVDDGSTDGTAEIIASYNDPRIRLFKNATNERLAATLNRGLAVTQGELIARMDADDISRPERLARQVHFMEDRPHLALAGSGVRRFDEGGRTLEVSTPIDNPALLRWRHQFSNQFFHPTVIFRRSVLIELGLSYGVVPNWARRDVELTQVDHLSEDYLLFGLLAFRAPVSNLPDVLVDLRVHEASVSNSGKHHQLELARSVSALLLGLTMNRPVPRDVADLLYFTRAFDAPPNQVEAACSVLDEAFAAHVREFHIDAEAKARIKQDLKLRQRVLRSAHQSFPSRLLGFLSGPLVPADEEERRLVARSLLREPAIERLKRLRTSGLTAMRAMQQR